MNKVLPSAMNSELYDMCTLFSGSWSSHLANILAGIALVEHGGFHMVVQGPRSGC